jgi:hypothetical protein
MLPFFSVCIPQYARTPFLLEALRSLADQTFRDFEVCISDDCSPDGGQAEVQAFLRDHDLPFVFKTQPINARYDANLRAAIALARGRYCLLLGNDDALAGPDTLARLDVDMRHRGPCGVVVTDYEDFATGARAGRIRATENRGAGPEVAAARFRNFSFVSGLVLEREPAQRFATARWDGSEMYQTFIACRLIASGGPLLELAWSAVRKDIRVGDHEVDSYARRPRLTSCPIVERPIPLVQLGRLVSDAIAPHTPAVTLRRLNAMILRQLLRYTYPFWLQEYRRVQSWRFAAGIALAMRPRRIGDGMTLDSVRRLQLRCQYLASTLGGLFVPGALFRILRPWLYALAKRSSRIARSRGQQ